MNQRGKPVYEGLAWRAFLRRPNPIEEYRVIAEDEYAEIEALNRNPTVQAYSLEALRAEEGEE